MNSSGAVRWKENCMNRMRQCCTILLLVFLICMDKVTKSANLRGKVVTNG